MQLLLHHHAKRTCRSGFTPGCAILLCASLRHQNVWFRAAGSGVLAHRDAADAGHATRGDACSRIDQVPAVAAVHIVWGCSLEPGTNLEAGMSYSAVHGSHQLRRRKCNKGCTHSTAFSMHAPDYKVNRVNKMRLGNSSAEPFSRAALHVCSKFICTSTHLLRACVQCLSLF